MPGSVGNRVLDFGLTALADCTHICVTELEPTSYVLASVGGPNCLGYRAFAGNAFSAPSDHSVNGRYCASATITDGTHVTTGTAAWWAAIDAASVRLLAHAPLVVGGVVVPGTQFNLPPFSIRLPAS